MSGATRRTAAWGLLAALLVSFGFAAWLLATGLVLGADADPDRAQRLHTALTVYGLVVLTKGLLPAVGLAVVLFALLDRGGLASRHGRRGVVVAIAAASGLASAVVVGLLLPSSFAGLPAARYRGPGHGVQSAAELALAVALALGIARALLGRLGTRPASERLGSGSVGG